MRMYLAGNFVIMGDKEKEKEFQSRLEPCLRLGTFFYKKELNTLLSIKKEQENENKSKKIEGQEKSTENSTENRDNKISQNSKKAKTPKISKNKKRRIVIREKRNS
jgi:hypothetical protein